MRSQQTRKRMWAVGRRNERSGALTVEMALVVPILFLLLFACYDFSRANMIAHAADSAAYEAARAGVLPGTNPAKIRSAAAFVLGSVGVSDFNVEINPTTIDNTTESVNIQISIPYRSNVSVPGLFAGDPTFRGECTLGRETL